ncbi:pseudouridine synthase [Metamycoplasma hyosynoviae]|uniref:pseudouridine synthase n=1 Tax=Metamycoplasma hyosynoviae TaxID=29559 RepID=UPI00235FF91F|nr:pseudouridine synthase [Metamycoplasma hyosynoviae]MDD1378452.1 pseudouridine synthase [Metamycoplasma hyosynoviae]
MKQQVRIEKYIGDITTLSRKVIKQKLKQKAIKVNGILIIELIKINPEKDIVELDGSKLEYNKFQYYMFNKPAGFITANNDWYNSTIFDILGLKRDKFFAFGRLDKDTEGLLIISNDGQMCHTLLSPKNHVPKKYLVRVDKKLDSEVLNKNLPIKINDEFTVENYLFEKINDKTCYITIYEGKFHQVKKMFATQGCSVLYLKRIQFGKLQLDPNLKLGSIRKLTEEEIKLMQEK